MLPPLFGVETEYALAGLRPDGSTVPVEQVAHWMMNLAQRQLPHLPDGRGSLFLANGARLYVDHGGHPELATAECTDPRDLVRQVLAGHRIVERLGQEAEASNPAFGEVLLLASNVDYGGSQATWGCHESYLYRRDFENTAAGILPHLVSRVIFTGAGGFDPRSAGLSFTLSPRAHHLEMPTSPDSTRSRGIVHTKDEPLSSGSYRRLHLICGESLRSERAMWLKVGTTALVVALIDAGIRPAGGVGLVDPIAALRAFAADPSCTARVPCESGGSISAIELQRHYLEQAEHHLVPFARAGWVAEVCREWRAVLDGLATDPTRLSGTLDWAIKRAVYEGFVRRRGFTWAAVRCWSLVRARLLGAWCRAGLGDFPGNLDVVLARRSPIRHTARDLGRLLRAWGEDWERLDAFQALRHKLFEIDTRFAQIGERGLFDKLAGQGILDHALPGLGDVASAMRVAPEGGRARLRGEWVSRLAAASSQYQCDWTAIWSHDGRYLSFADPFARSAAWCSAATGTEGLMEAMSGFGR
jgi:proteasome accessory factor A